MSVEGHGRGMQVKDWKWGEDEGRGGSFNVRGGEREGEGDVRGEREVRGRKQRRRKGKERAVK